MQSERYLTVSVPTPDGRREEAAAAAANTRVAAGSLELELGAKRPVVADVVRV
jgi:hypothetical protein